MQPGFLRKTIRVQGEKSPELLGLWIKLQVLLRGTELANLSELRQM